MLRTKTEWRNTVDRDSLSVRAALRVMDRSNWVSIEDVEIQVISQNPLKILLLKEAYLSLSEEAKFVLRLVLDTPDELTDFLKSQKRTISTRRLKLLVEKAGINYSRVKEEINGFIRQKYGNGLRRKRTKRSAIKERKNNPQD
jgi:hypothetical protein